MFDRLLKPDMNLSDAAKLTLVSFDSTMRSNLSVGLPIDMLCYDRNALAAPIIRRFGEGDPYLLDIRRRWGEALRRAFHDIPGLDLENAP